MYDNIRLVTPYPFENESERISFCDRFGLFIKDEKKGILHNRGYETLKQNKGIYIRCVLPNMNNPGYVALSFSLHKYYNAISGKGLHNYNDFNFNQANEAYRHFKKLILINLDMAVVKKYEVGINVTTTTNPDGYMKELDRIEVKGRRMRIIEDVHFKEYQQYSTHKDRTKRIVYIFYNKTHEARSKTKDEKKREAIPDNVLRAEKDNHRPIEQIMFCRLFDTDYQQTIKSEFIQRFVKELHYKKHPAKTKGMSSKRLEMINEISKYGTNEVRAERKRLFKNGVITRGQYEYLMKQIKEIEAKGIKVEMIEMPPAKELKGLLTSKLSGM